jgi:surface antigen
MATNNQERTALQHGSADGGGGGGDGAATFVLQKSTGGSTLQGGDTFQGTSVGGNVTITVDTPGQITWAGQAVGLKTSVAVSAGAVTWSGQASGLTTKITPTAGAITWAGATDITLAVTGNIVVTVTTPGAIAWTGQTVGLKTSLGITAGALTWAGQSVGLSTKVGLVPGAITWAGQSVGLRTSIVPTVGAITWAGQTVGLKTSVGVAPGAVTWQGQEILLAGPPPLVVLPNYAIFGETERPDRWDATERPGRWMAVDRPGRWDATERPDFWHLTVRPSRLGETERPSFWAVTIFAREDRDVALTLVAYGPFTENEVPEALLVRVMKPLRAGGTAPMSLFNQTPAYAASVSIKNPASVIVTRTADILDPATLPTLYPDDFSASELGWVRVVFQPTDFNDGAGTYEIQVALDNGTVVLKSTDVWQANVNVGPASAVT